MLINVRDFGAKGDGKANDVRAIARALKMARQQGGAATVFLPAGRYRLGTRGKTADLRPHIRIADFNELVLEGEAGTALVSSDFRSDLIRIERSTNVTIRRLALDCDPLPFTQGILENPPFQGVKLFRPDSGFSSPMHPTLTDMDRLSTLDSREEARSFRGEPVRRIVRREPCQGRLCEIMLDAEGARFWVPVLIWKQLSRGWGVSAVACTDCVLEHITVHSAAAGGFDLWKNRGTIRISHCTIGVPPKSPRLMAAPCGVSVRHNRGCVIVNHCFFSRIFDPGIGVESAFARIVARIDERTYLIEPTNVTLERGDTVVVWDWDNLTERGDVKVETAEQLPNGSWLVIFTEPACIRRVANDSSIPDRVAVIEDAGPVRILHNRIRVMLGRCISVTAPDTLIEGNLLYNSETLAIAAGADVAAGIGPAVRGLTIRGNRIVNISHSNIRIGVFGAPSILDPVNHNVLIEGNAFEAFGGAGYVSDDRGLRSNAIYATDCDGISVVRNRIGLPDLRYIPPAIPSPAALLLDRCTAVTLAGNDGLE